MENQQEFEFTPIEPYKILAFRQWFSRKKLENLGSELDLTKEEVAKILKSSEYINFVGSIMISTRTPEKLKRWWVKTYADNSSEFAKRMGLKESVVQQLIEKILKEYC